jgi:gliding motility-associated-like protein
MRLPENLNILKILFVLIMLLSAQISYADHLKGGWMKYTFMSKTGSTLNYRVSFYQYSDCGQREKVDAGIYMAVFAANSSQPTMVKYVPQATLTTESKNDFGPCFQNPPFVCYLVAEYTTTVSVPENEDGYTLSVQRCCRIAGIANVPVSNSFGLTYTITIPGGSSSNDNSPVFSFNDASAICVGSPFSFDFSAKDIDGDELVYSLCSGITGGTQFEPVVENPAPPPYRSISYTPPYSGAQPLGANVSIDPVTGILSGIAPDKTGTYVTAVCIDEYRNGKYIGHTRKELHLEVSNCKLCGAQLDPTYITCDGYDFTFVNKAGNNPNYTYSWDFGVTTLTSDTSSNTQPTYIYPDTGVYTVRLKAQNNAGCEDSAKAEVKIFPGFKTDFSIDGSCIFNPYNFKDLTTTKYGFVDSWKWYFGDEINDGGGFIPPGDTIQYPTHKYADTGQKTITLITTNSKGCIDTATKVLPVNTGPDVAMGFRDTLICSIDTLRLNASSSTTGAAFNWLPAYNLIGSNTAKPYVYPKQTTKYNLTVSYKGCVAEDSVTVNVIDKVLLELPADTAICKTDSIQLTPATNALYFSWTPAQGLSSDTAKAPVAVPLANTKYAVTASVGKCKATDAINVTVVPYPSAEAGDDISICYGTTTQLHANIEGSSFSWTPVSSLVNARSLSPLAGPQSTTTYILSVTDTIGCPKPVSDSVVVSVIPRVMADAGNDTVIVRQQPLQLEAKGGTNYQWIPASGLSDAFIANPVATFTDGPDTVSYKVKVSTPEGCFSYDSLKIYIFETDPQVFIPTAFSPNGDGINDVYKITAAGMKQFSYFRIYNRWGQLLFNTGTPNKGWDGTYNGNKQPSGTYVYVVEATDYNNKPYLKRGTFVLIR